MKAIPYMTEEGFNSYKSAPTVCAKQWPLNFEAVKTANGNIRPKREKLLGQNNQ